MEGAGRETDLAATDAVLLALLGAGVIPVLAVAVGHGNIRLLDVAEHLVVELLAQCGLGCDEVFGVCILGFQVRRRIGIGLIAQPPMLRVTPCTVVSS